VLTALVTAFYSFRLVFVTFWGPSRVDSHHAAHVHEPSSTMTVPLQILAVLSIVTGYLGIPEFLSPMFDEGGRAAHESSSPVVMVMATAAGLFGIGAAYYAYVLRPGLPDRWAQQWRTAYEWSLHKWYVDEAYDKTVVRPTFAAADELWKRMDIATIDGAVNGVARAIGWGAWFLRLLQSGQTQHYALGMALGAVAILTMFLIF
jgi:NADH-quinone oxidoreductase subunit L